MITEAADRIKIYVASVILGLGLNAINYYAYLYEKMDGNILMIASMAVPLISAYYVTKMTFKQGLIGAVCLSISALIFGAIDWIFDFNPEGQRSLLYGLGWGLSEFMWFFAPFIFQLMMGGIAALFRFLREKKRIEKELGEEED